MGEGEVNSRQVVGSPKLVKEVYRSQGKGYVIQTRRAVIIEGISYKGSYVVW